MPETESKIFPLLLAGVSLAFAWILWPYSGAILWGTVLAIVFAPVDRRLTRAVGQRRNIAAFLTVTIILLLVILPLGPIGALLAQEAAGVYTRIQGGELNFGEVLRHGFNALPVWAVRLLAEFGLTNGADIQARLAAGLAQGSRFLAAQIINLGQNTFDFFLGLFVMLYLLFFLLRDGDGLLARIGDAVPLAVEHRRAFFEKFTTVIRATIKGNVVVALVQGSLGGFIFWILGIHAPLLWAAVMTLLSMLPVLGAALIWLPVALYFLAAGPVIDGIVLIAFGVVVISAVDNLLRPVLVGKDTSMPDYVVLISTLGGIAVFGLNGFVIGPVTAALFISAWDIFAASRIEKAGGDSSS